MVIQLCVMVLPTVGPTTMVLQRVIGACEKITDDSVKTMLIKLMLKDYVWSWKR